MKTLNISDLRAHLPGVIDGVERTKEVVIITRYGKPIARIVPFRAADGAQASYPLRGRPIRVAPDFDEPMPGLWAAVRE